MAMQPQLEAFPFLISARALVALHPHHSPLHVYILPPPQLPSSHFFILCHVSLRFWYRQDCQFGHPLSLKWPVYHIPVLSILCLILTILDHVGNFGVFSISSVFFPCVLSCVPFFVSLCSWVCVSSFLVFPAFFPFLPEASGAHPYFFKIIIFTHWSLVSE